MAIVEFSCVLPSCKYYFADKTEAVFLNGRFRTNRQSQIDELNAEIELGHPHIHSPREVSELKEDPLAGMRAKLRAEFIAELKVSEAAAINPGNNMGGDKALHDAAFGAQSTNDSLVVINQEATATAQAKPVKIPLTKV